MPMFVVAAILLIVGSQEKAPLPGKGEKRRNDHEYIHESVQYSSKTGAVHRTSVTGDRRDVQKLMRD